MYHSSLLQMIEVHYDLADPNIILC
jgi:hypothetical protein